MTAAKDQNVISKNLIAIITALIVTALTAAVTFTYKTSTEIALVNQQMTLMSTQINKMDAKLENIQMNYATRESVANLEVRVRELEIKQAGKK